MFYLPRLYVYHADAKAGSELSETLKIMERRLLRIIINPAMILSYVFGIWMIAMNPDLMHNPWMHVKLTFVLLMTLLHAFLSRTRRHFAADRNQRSAKFYRILNEVPTLFLAVIVVMVIVKPSF